MASHLCSLTVGLLISAHACAVPPLYAQIARQQQVPAELLYAVARAESGSRLEQGLHPVAVDAEYCRNRLPLPQPFFSLPGIAHLRPYPQLETHRCRAGTD